jgi:hypothetical protein
MKHAGTYGYSDDDSKDDVIFISTNGSNHHLSINQSYLLS